MTAFNGEVVLRAVRAVAAGELGSKRKAVDSTGNAIALYSPTVIEVTDEQPVERSAFFRPGSWFALVPGPILQHPSSPSTRSNMVHKAMDIVVQGLTSGGKGFDRELELQGRALTVANAIADALGFDGNLTLDDRGQQTAIVDGSLLAPGGTRSEPVAVIGPRDCHLIRWRVSGVAILELTRET